MRMSAEANAHDKYAYVPFCSKLPVRGIMKSMSCRPHSR